MGNSQDKDNNKNLVKRTDKDSPSPSIPEDDDRNIPRKKLLLLGAGAVGKSTFFKHIIILDKGFSDLEKQQHIPSIHSNVANAIHSLCFQSKNLSAEFPPVKMTEEQLIEDREKILGTTNIFSEFTLTKEFAEMSKRLWESKAIQETYTLRHLFQLLPDAPYFLSQVSYLLDDESQKKKYVPSNEDVLRVRMRTSGIIEYEFKAEKQWYKLVDNGGERSERKKWIHLFDDVSVVLFFVNLDGYDRVIIEDSTGPLRLIEDLILWDTIVNEKCFKDTPFILCFNQLDRFEEKIKNATTSLTITFPDFTPLQKQKHLELYSTTLPLPIALLHLILDYEGQIDLHHACEFIEKKFLEKIKGDEKQKERVKSLFVSAIKKKDIVKIMKEVHKIAREQDSEGGTRRPIVSIVE